MAAQGEADYLNRKEMQKRGIDVAKAARDGRYKGRAKATDPSHVVARRMEHGASINATAEHFDISSYSQTLLRQQIISLNNRNDQNEMIWQRLGPVALQRN